MGVPADQAFDTARKAHARLRAARREVAEAKAADDQEALAEAREKVQEAANEAHRVSAAAFGAEAEAAAAGAEPPLKDEPPRPDDQPVAPSRPPTLDNPYDLAEYYPTIAQILHGPTDPEPPDLQLPEWHGWGMPETIVLFGEPGAGKSTIAADWAAWATARDGDALVVTAEATSQWMQTMYRYPPADRFFIWPWEEHGAEKSPAHLAERTGWQFDFVIVDPLVAALSIVDLEENANGALRTLMTRYVRPAVKPGGRIALVAHSGHENKTRGRGASDLKGWARLEARYKRPDNSKVGQLERTKANVGWDTYHPLGVALTADGLPRVFPSEEENPTSKAFARIEAYQLAKENPGMPVPEFAKLCGVEPRTVRRWINNWDDIELKGSGNQTRTIFLRPEAFEFE